MMRSGAQKTAKSLVRQFHSGRTMRFDWQKLVTPFTSKAWVAEMQNYEKDLNTKKVASGSLASTVEPIDWAHWEATIATDGVVAELKKEYEAMTFAPVQADGSEISAEKEASMIAEAEADVRMAQYELKAADKVLGLVTKAKNEGQQWTCEEWEAFVPGLNSKFDADWDNEDYLPSAASVKLHSTDFKDVQNRIKAGDKTVVDDIQCDDLVGDISTNQEIELINNGEWSIARLFAGAEERAAIAAEVKRLKAGQ